jgi:hypothetical protein
MLIKEITGQTRVSLLCKNQIYIKIVFWPSQVKIDSALADINHKKPAQKDDKKI